METMFWKRLKELCDANGTTPTTVCKEVGLSTGNPPMWKRGSLPSKPILEKLAAHFGVEPEYFVAETKTAPGQGADDALKFALFGGGGEITDEMFDEVKRFAAYVRAREEGNKK